jgi:hypothetical protein
MDESKVGGPIRRCRTCEKFGHKTIDCPTTTSAPTDGGGPSTDDAGPCTNGAVVSTSGTRRGRGRGRGHHGGQTSLEEYDYVV